MLEKEKTDRRYYLRLQSWGGQHVERDGGNEVTESDETISAIRIIQKTESTMISSVSSVKIVQRGDVGLSQCVSLIEIDPK